MTVPQDSFGDLTSGEMTDLNLAACDFIYQFNLLVKLAAIHDRANEALRQPAKDICLSVRKLLEFNAPWYLKKTHEHLFMNQNRLRMDMENYPQYISMIEELRKRNIGRISFERVPKEDEAIAFIYLFQEHKGEDDFDRLANSMENMGLGFIHLDRDTDQGTDMEESREKCTREIARETFFGAIYMTGGLLRSVNERRNVNIRRARRAIQSFLELLEIDEDYLLGMTSIKNYDDYTFNHSVNVTILALSIGRFIGLNRAQLADLGLSAIFHDLGKISLPRSIVGKRSTLNDKEWEEIHRHPVEGVKKLLRLKGASELTVKLVISVYEHHLNYDVTGYPKLALSKEASLFSRILRIVDSYDAMTAKRCYCDVPKHPVAALEEIWNLAGKNYDPDLVKVFINVMGIYPVGTIVQLEGGEIGMVAAVRRGSDGNGPQPVIRVLAEWEERGRTGQIIDFSKETDSSIVGYYDFASSGVNPAWYLLTMGE